MKHNVRKYWFSACKLRKFQCPKLISSNFASISLSSFKKLLTFQSFLRCDISKHVCNSNLYDSLVANTGFLLSACIAALIEWKWGVIREEQMLLVSKVCDAFLLSCASPGKINILPCFLISYHWGFLDSPDGRFPRKKKYWRNLFVFLFFNGSESVTINSYCHFVRVKEFSESLLRSVPQLIYWGNRLWPTYLGWVRFSLNVNNSGWLLVLNCVHMTFSY